MSRVGTLGAKGACWGGASVWALLGADTLRCWERRLMWPDD